MLESPSARHREPPTRRPIPAARLTALSFLGLIAVGTIGFRILPGLATGPALGWIDALFMATSAVCVTGLVVVDVSRDLSLWGQAWLLVLIQAGGLGILTLAGVTLALVGKRMGLEAEEAAGGADARLPRHAVGRMLRTAVGFSLTLEAAGAALLWLVWPEPTEAGRRLWLALFHSVSAFCNAGFSLFSDSFVGFRDAPGLLLVSALLIVIGGLGFPVILDLRDRASGRRRRLHLHTRLVLLATAGLLAISTGLYLVFEWNLELGALDLVDRAVNAFFMAVTARTAGFNSVDYDAVSNPSLFLTLALMWIGGAPASFAGGVKVTTVALLGLLLWSRLAGHAQLSLAGRTVPRETVQRAGGLTAGAVLLLGTLLLLLLMSESVAVASSDRLQLVRLVFELQSAFSTVGLSMGVTPELTPLGRLVLVPTMILGRIGPLVVLAAMAARVHRRVDFRYAHEDVLVG